VKQQPLVSVIIPAYNNAEYLGDAIESVLQQTYSNLELIIVNDASPDDTVRVIRGYDDSRIRYIVHEHNKGLSAARNTGIQAAMGEFIALLDGDDYFHPEKLRLHMEFMEKNSDIGATYNARFELSHSAKTIRAIWRPPLTVGLKELVFGFPFGPSDMVIRREWVVKINMFDEYYVYVGEDLDFNCRLALAGCKFASVDRALNYRRYYSGRVIKNIPYFVDCTFRAMQATFTDPRCSNEVLALQNEAFASHYILWSAIAFAQNDVELGQEYCLAAIQMDPTFLKGLPPKYADEYIKYCILDDTRDPEELLRNIFRQLPGELRQMAKQGEDWVVARSFLLKGIQSILWGRLELGKQYIAQAMARGAKVSNPLFTQISSELINYEREFGSRATHRVIENLMLHINKIEGPTNLRWSEGLHLVNRAFMSFNEGKYARVPIWILKAITLEPAYLVNNGVIKIFLLSLVRQLGVTSLY